MAATRQTTGLADWLVGRFVSRSEAIADTRVRERYGVLEGWTSVAVNLVVFVVKIVPGLLIGSVSLIADAFHSLGDVASSAVVIWGFKAAARPSDREHPFGHGRVESVAALVIAVLLVVAALEFGRSSVARLLEPRAVTASWGVIAALAASLVLKEWLSRFSRDLGRRIGSTALIADFWHHRSDVLATAVVIAALVASRFGVVWVDGAAGLVVSGFLAWAGWMLVRESIDPLIGQAPADAQLAEINRLARSVPGVENVHDVIVHHYGGLVVTSLHVEVPATLTVMQGHELAEAVEQAVEDVVQGRATVHVDPVNREHPLWGEVDACLRATLAEANSPARFHDLRLIGRPDWCAVVFDLHPGDDEDGEALAALLRRAVARQFPAVIRISVTLEPRFAY